MTIPSDQGISILWRRIDRPGHESAILMQREGNWHLNGVAVFLHEGKSCCLSYRIVCDSDWRTRSVEVTGWVGHSQVQVQAKVEPAGVWNVNGEVAPHVAGCTDIDLNFSPSTNLLPIRRLRLAIGEEKEVVAAWLRFPSFNIEPLRQSYRRLSQDSYRYQSGGGRFEAELKVNSYGFVTLYPEVWQEEGS
ncbi:MAG TPA: putative glycolipid-binding domain-containing protein [Acidobacteriota bacterium]